MRWPWSKTPDFAIDSFHEDCPKQDTKTMPKFKLIEIISTSDPVTCRVECEKCGVKVYVRIAFSQKHRLI